MDAQYLQAFIDESEEHLENLNDNIMRLESEQTTDVINEIFRSAHTLKGMAASMGFTNTSELTHSMEDVLQEIRNNKLKISDDIIDLLFKCLDALERFVTNIKNTAQEGDVDVKSLMESLKNLLADKTSGSKTNSGSTNNSNINTSVEMYEKNVVIEAAKQGFNAFRLEIKISRSCQLKAARAYVIFNSLKDAGDIINSVPSVEDIEKGNINDTLCIDIITKLNEAKINEILQNISELVSIKTTKLDFQSSSKKSEEKNAPKKEVKLNKTIRVEVNKLDEMMNMVGELLITKSRIKTLDNELSNKIKPALDYLDRITSDLHDTVMSLRMEPIERVFNRFPRMVRDLSKKLNKNVDFIIEGKETEVDMTIIDELSDPLVHLIRNSMDHGIEEPQERLRSGKPEVGKLELKAYHDGNKIVIMVSDDGKGIDTKQVLNKAISKGIISESDKLTKKQAIDLLFMSGFSTSDKVSEISGRGVGLDVVKSKVEELGGSIEIITELGKGTTFLLNFPLTLSMIEALLIKVSGEVFAVSLNTVIEILDVDTGQIKRVRNTDTFVYNGEIIPIIKLGHVLKLDMVESNPNNVTVLIVRKGDNLIGIAVDGVIGEQEIVIKSPGKYLADYKFISGVTILGNGDISLIIDITQLI